MIDINELRRLVKAATPGPWKVGQYLGSPRQFVIHMDVGDKGRGSDVAFTSAAFGNDETIANARLIAAANPAALSELLDRLETAERDNALKEEVIDSLAVVIKKLETETSAELEAAERERDDVAQQLVQAEIGKRKLEAECDALRAKIAQMERQEPVEWRTFDGEGGYDYRNFAGNEDYQAVWEAINPNHKGWVEPLYALPGAQPAPGAPWVSLAERMPNPEEHDRVLIYTEGYDFGGEQVFDVKAEALNECRYIDPDEQPETCKAASHWMPLPRNPMFDYAAHCAQPAPSVPDDVMRDAKRYRLIRRGQHWSVVDGIGDHLRADDLDSAVDRALAAAAPEVKS